MPHGRLETPTTRTTRRPPRPTGGARRLVAGAAVGLAAAACGEAVHAASSTTAQAAQAAQASRAPRGPDGGSAEPVIFAPGVISDGREQWRITFTPNGKVAYFAASDRFFPVTRQATIYVTRRTRDGWSPPEVAPFSGRYSDIDPFVTPDGRRLYFSSIRPVNGVVRGDIDLWVVERTRGRDGEESWGEPVRLGDEVNSPADELYASASADGTLYFASGPASPQPGRDFDIYRAERRGSSPDGPRFAPRVAVGPGVNTAPVPGGGLQDAWEFNPEVSVDGRTLLFTSLRPGGFGLGDLYVSTFERGAWSPARNLGPAVNTSADEYHPTLSRDRGTLYFVRRGPAPGDFYRIAARELRLR
ncbi:MAG TPA: hypothetical protein VEZ47_06810 [Gemmatirosa sp.]|nr:hypothetical protein [Gemmatirosa sp.]